MSDSLRGSRADSKAPRRPFGLGAAAIFLALAPACSAPKLEVTSAEGRAAILDAVNKALTGEDCATAINLIEDLYFSPFTDNRVRLIRASAYGCGANVNFFELIGKLPSENLGLPDFWQSMAKLFPSSDGDGRVESAYLATDALQAALNKPVGLVAEADLFDADTVNPASLNVSDRVPDANVYLMLISMALIGSTERRHGADPVTFKKDSPLPWDTGASIAGDEEGCAYVGATLNLVDSIRTVGDLVRGDVGDDLLRLQAELETAFNAGCSLGCLGLDSLANTVDAGCAAAGFTAGDCDPCPIALRHREGCVGDDSAASCAAAGLIRVINDDASIGWNGP